MSTRRNTPEPRGYKGIPTKMVTRDDTRVGQPSTRLLFVKDPPVGHTLGKIEKGDVHILGFCRDQTPALQIAAVTSHRSAIHGLYDPTDAAQALHKILWGEL